ncbi:MAG: hypothetical protein F6K14_00410 [Symploca sp. SIO2C1]|nr:hypothetical protein [Symploca sp. SIO2C1]
MIPSRTDIITICRWMNWSLKDFDWFEDVTELEPWFKEIISQMKAETKASSSNK